MARLSTHVLDTARGIPAKGVRIELHSLAADTVIATTITNEDGRTSQPLLSEGRIEPGPYQLRFHVGEYFRTAGLNVTDPPFLDIVIVQFGIADPLANYHVPLLISPYGYSTYKGS